MGVFPQEEAVPLSAGPLSLHPVLRTGPETFPVHVGGLWAPGRFCPRRRRPVGFGGRGACSGGGGLCSWGAWLPRRASRSCGSASASRRPREARLHSIIDG